MITTEQLKESFADLRFEDQGHMYFREDTQLPSVTGVIKNFYKPFDPSIAKFVAKHKGITAEELQAQWKEAGRVAIELGNRVHEYAEDLGAYYKGFSRGIRAPQDFKELGIYQFYQGLDKSRYILVAIELRIYHPERGYAGTADAIFYDKERDGLIIVDWKTNKTLFKNSKKSKMLGPFTHLEDNKFNHYQVQLSLYRMALESKGYNVVDHWIVWVDSAPNESTMQCFTKFETEFYKEEIEEFFEGQLVNSEFV